MKVVQNLVQRWQPEGLASIVHTVCTFLKDISFQSVTCESPHATGDNTDDDDDNDSNVMITDKVYIPGATYLSVTFDSRLVIRSLDNSYCFFPSNKNILVIQKTLTSILTGCSLK